MKPHYTLKQAANLLNKSEETVRRMCKAGEILCYSGSIKRFDHEQSVIVIPQAEFDKWLKERKNEDL